MPVKMKMWVGNLDGSRRGLVIASSKKRARELLGTRTSLDEFNAYWRELPIDPTLDVEVLYTRPFDASATPWVRGRCPVKGSP